ncbi:Recombination endonuclease VII [Parafrankia sp. EUN1f]|uniref:Recombination endonuclease VII n=1 Tax=Parafrankia sp. EUN1f TaxID=102897 RepID=UPI0001C459AD|nr:Recombination endonuclease VII [Parafrankia sp. EUN1f]EFC86500.1 Recombination endonuclease VII [Parafrankia sp. EUN1f]
MSAGEKACTRCKKRKKGAEFHRNARNPDGLQTYCQECARELRRKIPSWRKYGLTDHDFETILAWQGYSCAVCQLDLSDVTGRGRGVDHDHACHPLASGCGICVRGILCRDCNVIEGYYRPDSGLAIPQIDAYRSTHADRIAQGIRLTDWIEQQNPPERLAA